MRVARRGSSTSKIDRVLPAGGWLGSTPGRRQAGRADSSRSDAVDDTGVGVSASDCRNGWFCAFDDDVPPGVKFQNIAQAAANDRFAVAAQVVGEPEPRPDVALRVGLQTASDVDAADRGVVRRDDELAGSLVEVRLAVVDLDPRRIDVPPQAQVQRQLARGAPVVLRVDARTPAASPCRSRLRPRPSGRRGSGSSATRSRAGSSPRRSRCCCSTRNSAGWPGAVRGLVVVELELPDDLSALRISRERSVRLPPAFSVCRPLIQVTLSKIWKSFWFVISGWLLFGPEVPDVLEVKLGHRRGGRR